MLKSKGSRVTLIVVLVLVLALIGGAIAAASGAKGLAFARVPVQYPLSVLIEEGDTMSNCAECHETEEFHTCSTCHDEHGAIEMENVPFYAVVAFVGDVPEPGFVLIDDILPYRDQPHTFVPLLSFLDEQGVADFESVTLASRDEGFVTIERSELTDDALLMPYEDGIRFAAENLHVSAWLKGITRIVVVGAGRPLRIDGQATSMGRLLLGPSRSVTVEQTDVMLKSEADGQIRRAKTAARIEGAPIEALVAHPIFSRLIIRDAAGEEYVLTAGEASGAVLYQSRRQVVLVLPERGRSQWIDNVIEIVSEE